MKFLWEKMTAKNLLHFHDCDYATLLNEVVSLFEKYEDWEHRLILVSERHDSLKSICSIISEIIQRPFFITDLYGKILICSIDEEENLPVYWTDMIREGVIPEKSVTGNLQTLDGQLRDDMSPTPIVYKNNMDEPPYIGMYLQENNVNFGAIIISQPDNMFTTVDLQIVSMLSPYILSAEEFTSASSELKPDVMILFNLLNGDKVNDNLISDFENKRFPGPWRLLNMRHITRVDLVNYRRVILQTLTIPYGSRPVEFEEQLYMLIAADDKEKYLEALGARIISAPLSIKIRALSGNSLSKQIIVPTFIMPLPTSSSVT